MLLLRIDEQVAQMIKPALSPLTALALSERDVLVLCAGFEKRAIAALNLALKSSVQPFTVFMIDYRPYIKQNRRQEVLDLCNSHGLKLKQFVYDRENPSGAAEEVLENLGSDYDRLFVDVSGMSRLLIVQLIVEMGQQVDGFKRCTIIYTEARNYPPSKSEVKKALLKQRIDPNYAVMFLSSGVFEVCIVPELSSVAQQGQPSRLIAFPSFNPDQFAALRSVVQPSFFTIINGMPPDNKYQWRLEAIREMNSILQIPNKKEYTTSTLDYRKTLSLLLDLYSKNGAIERFIVTPTGSKMQALAVGLLRAYLDDVQIVYPIPRSFDHPELYTSGVKQIYSVSLNSFPAPK